MSPDSPLTNRPRVTLAYLMAAMVALLVIGATALATVLIVNASRPEPFDPFQLPDQTVLSRMPGVNVPAAKYTELLKVRGTKCNLEARPVSLTSVRVWATEAPPGTIVFDARGVGALPPGCTTETFQNPIPAAVLVADRRLRSSGIKHPLWRITAELTPQGKHVIARSWRTEPFELVP